MSPFPLPPFGGPGWGDFGWTILLAVAAAVVVFAIMELARWAKRAGRQRPFLLTIAAGLAVGGLAIAFAEATDKSPDAVLFSGQEAFGSLFGQAATISLSTLALLLLFKGLAWSISLGNFRGGPTFPAIFLGVVAGLMAGTCPATPRHRRSPRSSAPPASPCSGSHLSSVMIATLLSAKAGLAVAPLIVVAVAVAYLDKRSADRLRRRPRRRRCRRRRVVSPRACRSRGGVTRRTACPFVVAEPELVERSKQPRVRGRSSGASRSSHASRRA